MNHPYQERDKYLVTLGYSTYIEYLASPLWKSIRSVVLADKSCRCGKKANSVHHANYDLPTLAGDSLEWLIACCATCHRRAEKAARFISDPMDRIQTVTACLFTGQKAERNPRRPRKAKTANSATWRVERVLAQRALTTSDRRKLKKAKAEHLRQQALTLNKNITPRLVKCPSATQKRDSERSSAGIEHERRNEDCLGLSATGTPRSSSPPAASTAGLVQPDPITGTV